MAGRSGSRLLQPVLRSDAYYMASRGLVEAVDLDDDGLSTENQINREI
jgi:hypothetical protein